jgi:hypothetical protein
VPTSSWAEKVNDLEKHRQILRDRTGFFTLVGNVWFCPQDG